MAAAQMEDGVRSTGGLLGSLRGLAESLVGSARDRLELLSLELQEEKLRFFQTFIWLSAAIFSAILVVTFASLTIVYLFWATARLQVLAGFTVVYLIAFLVVLRRCRQILARPGRPFEATLAELHEDRACIQPRS